MLQKLQLLRALVDHNEGLAAEPLRRGGSSRDGNRGSAMDIDGASDSPAPSPLMDKPFHRKDRGAGRSSLPPKDSSHTPIKQESTEAAGSSTVIGSVTASSASGGAEVNSKGKITFAMGAEVAFRPKATGSEEPEWIQGVVVKIIGEGKSRRYDVQDPEPDEVTKKPGQVYRTSASSMVTIPPLGQPLADYPKGKGVLARYPDTTTFYRAEVVGMNGRMVNLKFEGEEDAQVTMEVDRRFVLDHRG
jgi:SAGA-associated factor 29